MALDNRTFQARMLRHVERVTVQSVSLLLVVIELRLASRYSFLTEILAVLTEVAGTFSAVFEWGKCDPDLLREL